MRSSMRRLTVSIPLAALLALTLAACGGEGGGGDGGNGGSDGNDGGMGGSGGTGGGNPAGMATGEGPCGAAEDCAGDVCVALIDGDNPPIYCSEQCPDGACPDGFYCDDQTFSLAGLSFCRFGATEPEMPETPAQPPRLPCREDADCEDGLVCGTFMGERDCTIPCAMEDDCTPPSLGGITLDLATCGQDEGEDRMICVPDTDCYPDPIAAGCVQGFPGPGF